MSTNTASRSVPALEEATQLPQPELVDLSNTRSALGGISKQTVYRLVADGELGVVKIRRRTFFRRRDIEALIARATEVK
jgi:excisionase family DNA binding protein